eukprot:12591592-Heterocapsa_arctica.AAC.1
MSSADRGAAGLSAVKVVVATLRTPASKAFQTIVVSMCAPEDELGELGVQSPAASGTWPASSPTAARTSRSRRVVRRPGAS